MKKHVISLLVGITMLIAATAYAEEIQSMIGKAVDGEFSVSVNDVTLDKKAIVIEGTSYLPVRAIGEALGTEIYFDADLGIKLMADDATAVTAAVYQLKAEQLEVEKVQLEQDKLKMQQEIAELKRKNGELIKQENLNELNQIEINKMKNELEYKKNRVKGLEDDLDQLTDQEKPAIQAEIDKLKAEIAELEAKLSE